MVTDDLEGALLSRLRELGAMVLLVDDQRRLLRSEFLQHVGYRGRCDRQMGGDFGAGDLAFRSSTQLKDRFEVVIDRFAARGGGYAVGFGRALERSKRFFHRVQVDLA